MSKTFILHAPLEVVIHGRKKTEKFILNLNNYRNAHYQILNKAKIAYKDAMASQILELDLLGVVKVYFKLFPATRRLVDIPNPLSIHDKFLMDALVGLGKLKDDNYKHYVNTDYSFGCVDKDNPRVEITIEEVGIQLDGVF